MIDGLQFARTGSELAGEIEGGRLHRLAEMGGSTDMLRFRLIGGLNSREKLEIRVRISAVFRLTCQRCLRPMDYPIDQQNRLELAGSFEEIEAAEDDVDRLLAGKAMDVEAIVEDEAILALPMIPRHEVCEVGAVAGLNKERESPFDALAALKQRK